MWQEVLILIIAVIVIGYVGYKIYCFFTQPAPSCNSCAGCSLKEQLKSKNRNCKEFKPKKRQAFYSRRQKQGTASG
jgi:hypothetical protein